MQQEAASRPVIEVTEQNAQQVLEQSMQVPIVLAFMEPGDQAGGQTVAILERIAGEQQDQLLLGHIDAQGQPMLVQQFGVQGLPNFKLVYQGRLVDELNGAQTEARLREWLAPVLGGEQNEEAREDEFIERVQQAIRGGQAEQAEQALRQTLEQAPDKHRIRAVLVEFLLGEGRSDEAQSVLAEVAEDVEELRPFRARFALLEELEGEDISPLATLAERVEAADADPADLYAFGLQAAAAGRFEEGLDTLLRLLRDHRDWKDGAAQRGLLKVLECLPKGDPLASDYRRKMFNYLY